MQQLKKVKGLLLLFPAIIAVAVCNQSIPFMVVAVAIELGLIMWAGVLISKNRRQEAQR